jgi:hypothetical protein
MANIYRVRYKKGDVELDIESSDREYVDRKLAEVWGVGGTQRGASRGRSAKKEKTKASETGDNLDADLKVNDRVLADIIASINDAENYDSIAKRILDKTNRTARILLCYFFAHKHPSDPALTSTHVERLTGQLRIQIASPNVAKVIREGASRYLTADRIRERGIAVHYKINRRGITLFEKIVAGEKL